MTLSPYPKAMQRSLLILTLSFLLTACSGFKKSQQTSSGGPLFSWEKKEVVEANAVAVPQAPADAGKAVVVSFNQQQGLIALMRSEKAEVGSKLQLTKGDKALLVEVLQVGDTVTVVGIVAGQATSLRFYAQEEVGCAALAK